VSGSPFISAPPIPSTRAFSGGGEVVGRRTDDVGTFSHEEAEAAKVVLDYATQRRMPEKSGLRLGARS
jgi:hypothetical protein